MLFSSLTFLLLFLPLFMGAMYVTPDRSKNVVILIFSLIFYAWGEPIYILLMIGSVLVNFSLGRLICGASDNDKRRKTILCIGIIINLSMFAVMKYTDLFIRTVNFLIATEFPLARIALPIGISFYTFQTMSYLIDVYRKKAKASDNLIDFAAYVSMFPQLIAGPIVRYNTVEAELSKRTTTRADFAEGIIRFCAGLSKKVLIANPLGEIFEEVSAMGAQAGAASAWLGAIAFMLQIYFDFSGYSDMAIGLGKMMGFHFPENFDYPYASGSVTEFWRRWHISLGTWFREYVYIPLGGNRVSVPKVIVNLFIVWGLTGLWHGAEVNFLLWGLYYAVLLILEKYVYGRFLKKLPVIRNIYSLFFVLFGWVIFANTDMTKLLAYIKAMFTGGEGSAYALFTLKSNVVLFVIAIFLSLGAWPALKKMLNGRVAWEKYLYPVLTCLFIVASLILCIAQLLRGAYNPFLYFRF